jgi:hypothetical protein
MDSVRSILANSINREAIALLWLVIAAVLLFGVTFRRSQDDERAWVWGRRLLHAFLQAALFAGVLGMFYFLLNTSFDVFQRVSGSFTNSGSLSNRAWKKERNAYGGTFIQRDLQVRQYVPMSVEKDAVLEGQTMPLPDGSFVIEQQVAQTSITRFRGLVALELEDSQHQIDTFNTYRLHADYQYTIANPVDSEVRAEFSFPLSNETILYENLEIEMDGKSVAYLSDGAGAVGWVRQMQPGEKSTVSIQYTAKGMDGFLFEVVEQRKITDFELRIDLNGGWVHLTTEPLNGGIKIDAESYPIIWTIHDSIMLPRLGVTYIQGWPYAPRHEMVKSLSYSGRALILFLSLAVLTSIVFSVPFQLRQIVLMAGLFSVPFLILMAGGVPAPSWVSQAGFARYQINMLPVLSLVSLALAFWALPRQPRPVLILTLALMVLFMAGYPRIGLLMDEQKRNAIEGGIQVAMIAYVFVLTLFVRMRSLSRKKQD